MPLYLLFRSCYSGGFSRSIFFIPPPPSSPFRTLMPPSGRFWGGRCNSSLIAAISFFLFSSRLAAIYSSISFGFSSAERNGVSLGLLLVGFRWNVSSGFANSTKE